MRGFGSLDELDAILRRIRCLIEVFFKDYLSIEDLDLSNC